ncbi:DMT family transporter [Flagellimonas halotolerans]|uniref:DMT family transporter n=1 Tax=Flagellimonas halotolerans TaxID=3112164 RepID=A0ABU6IUN9_9FLAO|nr:MULTISPECIES: DMT family transporter [unclassified Allomuricauda]MEC3966982.1 DMT family transporter [Muricauda sp. SYSU M86414]MEC4266845.1 DMT family transporter [Muricauda sp. SYSU M84420]
MIYLILSVLSSTLIFVVFKLFDVFKIQTLYAIITNYVVACAVGFLLYDGPVGVSDFTGKPWLIGPILLGVLFIVIFNLMAKTAQVSGVSAASVATKMSLAIPVIVGVLLYGEHLSILQIIGIILALVAVYLASIKEESISINKKALILPLLVFLGSGIIDTSIQYFEEIHLTDQEIPVFSSMIFGFAALTGFIFVGIKAVKTPLKVNFKNTLGGIALGVPNYFSIYFLIRALRSDILSSAAIFTLNNVAIVMCSTLFGILLFKEKLSLKNWSGVALAILSIILVALF